MSDRVDAGDTLPAADPLYKKTDAGDTLSDSGYRSISIRQRMQKSMMQSVYQTAASQLQESLNRETLYLHPLSDRVSSASAV